MDLYGPVGNPVWWKLEAGVLEPVVPAVEQPPVDGRRAGAVAPIGTAVPAGVQWGA